MKKRFVFVVLFVAATSVILLSRFYIGIQDKHWKEEAAAVKIAYEKSVLVKADQVRPFYGDKPYQVITGQDKLGQKVIVWVADDEVHAEMAADGVNSDRIKEAVLKKAPDASILRIMPGKKGGQLVWEAFYKRKEDAGERYYYDYYAFKDGAPIDTYKLSLH
jgi:uncharacterized protein YpmB